MRYPSHQNIHRIYPEIGISRYPTRMCLQISSNILFFPILHPQVQALCIYTFSWDYVQFMYFNPTQPNSTPPKFFFSILANAKPAPAAARQRAVVSHCFCCCCWTQWRNSKVVHKKKSCQPQHCKFWPHQKRSCTETNSKSVKLLFIDSEMLVSMLIEIHVLISLHLSLHCGQTSNSKALSLCAVLQTAFCSQGP